MRLWLVTAYFTSIFMSQAIAYRPLSQFGEMRTTVHQVRLPRRLLASPWQNALVQTELQAGTLKNNSKSNDLNFSSLPIVADIHPAMTGARWRAKVESALRRRPRPLEFFEFLII